MAHRQTSAAVVAILLAACSSSLPPHAALLSPSPAATPSTTASAILLATALPTRTSSGTPSLGIARETAIEVARTNLADPEAAILRSAFSGPLSAAYSRLPGRPRAIPPDEELSPDRLVWAVEFAVTFDVCGPAGGTCQELHGIHTVFLDFISGEWLHATTWAPSPGEPLPTFGS